MQTVHFDLSGFESLRVYCTSLLQLQSQLIHVMDSNDVTILLQYAVYYLSDFFSSTVHVVQFLFNIIFKEIHSYLDVLAKCCCFLNISIELWDICLNCTYFDYSKTYFKWPLKKIHSKDLNDKW